MRFLRAGRHVLQLRRYIFVLDGFGFTNIPYIQTNIDFRIFLGIVVGNFHYNESQSTWLLSKPVFQLIEKWKPRLKHDFSWQCIPILSLLSCIGAEIADNGDIKLPLRTTYGVFYVMEGRKSHSHTHTHTVIINGERRYRYATKGN